MSKLITMAVSFIVFTACTNFEDIKQINMSFLNINIPGGTTQLSGNPVWVETSTSRTNVTEQYLLLKLICTNGVIDPEPRILSIRPGAATGAGPKTALFNISAMVDVPFDFSFFTDDGGETPTEYTIREGMVAVFTVEAGEQYVDTNNVLQTVWKGSPETLSVLKGKLDEYTHTSFYVAGQSFNSYYITGKRTLSEIQAANQTANMLYVEDYRHPVKAWVYFLTATPLFEGKMKLNYYGEPSVLVGINVASMPANSLVEFNLNEIARKYKHPAKRLKGYSFYNTGQTSHINVSANNVYVNNGGIIDDITYTENHSVLYLTNRLGVVETINCYGKLEQLAGTESETYMFPPRKEPDVFKRTIEANSKSNTKKFRINTGYKEKADRTLIESLFLSPYPAAWFKSTEIKPLFGKDYGFLPVTILNTETKTHDTDEDLISFDIEFTVAHNQ